ncbi:dephospho-CoA kinase [Helicobacter sp. 11S02629-2]|uniref:dephospho-CoA kinase n=1 Tax=Helicobacter sp. 11S02629-2 TaxID=1476195 RepID=UPI0015DB61AB|nr:dephospho-CoA kinase [Helicobacter sp. 11S02629-2]
MDKDTKAVILTGSIGCGKTTVANLLRLQGYKVIDVDKIAKDALEVKKDKVLELFGKDVTDTKGEIVRSKLGALVFGDEAKRKLLESLLHPYIYQEVDRQSLALEKFKVPYFLDLPLFFESTHHYTYRFVACVYAPKSMQLKRVMSRDGLDEKAALERIESQLDIEVKKEKSDFVIENIGLLKDLQANVESFLEKLEKAFRG